MPNETTLVLLDSQLAAEHFTRRFSAQNRARSNFIIIALNPNIKSHLQRNGYMCDDTQPYLSNEGRLKASYKSSELTSWIRNNFHFEDNLNITHGYIENLIWYTRWSYNHIIQSIEIITRAIQTHQPSRVMIFDYPKNKNRVSSYPTAYDMNIAKICEHYCSKYGISISYEQLAHRLDWKNLIKRLARKTRALITANLVVSKIHLRKVNKLSKKHPVLFTNDQYRLNTVANDIRSENTYVVKLQEWPTLGKLQNLFKHNKQKVFAADIQINALESLSKDDKRSRHQLKQSLTQFVQAMYSESQLFNYEGYPLAQPLADKIENGISPAILKLHRRASTLQNILNAVQPSMVLSNGCRTDDIITGELCRNTDIPSMIITHGSHVPTSSPESAHEWHEHARRLINAPYRYTALQSPLAEQFRNECNSSSKSILTGPVTWATPICEERSLKLKLAMLGNNSSDKIVVHAGTPKGANGVRFNVFETPDEYLQSIKDVSLAVNDIPNTCLIVMFRPIPEISTDTVKYIVEGNKSTIVSVTNPLIDILGFADVLVSFSSTVIEEALQNYTPVILYGGQGRYKHIDCPQFSHETIYDQASPIYHIPNKELLNLGIKTCLNRDITDRERAESFSSYIYDNSDIAPMNEIICKMITSRISMKDNLESL